MAERGASRGRRTGASSLRGSSFVEVLLAMTIMALVLVGILQMFSVSLILNKGAAARTQMLFKCQQVVENIRWYYYVTTPHPPLPAMAAPTGTNIPPYSSVLAGFPLTVHLPYLTTDVALGYAFWGPDGANVIEMDSGPYEISYTIVDDPTQTVHGTPTIPDAHVWVITVSAVPTSVAAATHYLGIGTNGGGKRVDYVAQFTQ